MEFLRSTGERYEAEVRTLVPSSRREPVVLQSAYAFEGVTVSGYDRINSSRSAFICSGFVVHIPCG
jgi:hypothetical protein